MSADFAKRITEAQERERLDAAIRDLRVLSPNLAKSASLNVVLAAAEAHLATMPKPPVIRFAISGVRERGMLMAPATATANADTDDEAMRVILDMLGSGYVVTISKVQS